MKISVKKRHTMLATLILILGVAVLANWYYTKPEGALPADSASDVDTSNVSTGNLGDAIYANADSEAEYFASAKLSRDEAYDEAVATLKEIVESSDIDSQSVSSAADSISSLSERRIAQADIENLIEAKTGSTCVAVVNKDSVDIIISGDLLSDSVVLQIKDIVLEKTDILPEKISIIGTK